MVLAEQIRIRRKEKGLSQEELAERIYVSRQTISNWETGRTYPDIESLLLLSILFDVTVDELIKGDVEDMRETINRDAKRMRTLGWTMALCTVAAIAVMLCGLTIWEWGIAPTLVSGFALTALALVPSFELERLKKKHDILTYAEISAFEKGDDINRNTPAGIRVRRHPIRNAAFRTAVGAAAGAIVGFTFVLVVYNAFGWRPF